MADYPAPVANQVKPPDPMQGINTYSGILGLKQQQQALQTGQYEQDTAKATSEQASQKNLEMQAAQTYLRNGIQSKDLLNPDGSVNRTKAADGLTQIAPTYGQDISGHLISSANEMVENKRALQGLGEQRQKDLSGYFGAVAAKPNATTEDVLDAAKAARGLSDDPAYQRMIDSNLMGFPQTHSMDPTQASTAIRQHARLLAVGANAASAPQSDPNVQTVQGPGGLVPTNINPQSPGGVGQVGPTQQQGVAPGAAPVTDAFGRTSVFNPQKNTVTPIGAGPSGQAPSAFAQPVAGQGQVQQDVDVARKAGDAGGQVRAINDKLLNLSDQTRTGPGAQSVQKIAAALNLPSGSHYQEINAYLERQAATAGQAMGLPNTNAGLHAAQQASGTAEYTPEALQEKVKFADALNSGAMAYRQGLDKLVGTGPTPDYSKYQDFRSAWAKNFSPDVFRAEDAIRRGDKKELESIKSELGSRGMTEMRKRSENLRMLENGQIPNG